MSPTRLIVGATVLSTALLVISEYVAAAPLASRDKAVQSALDSEWAAVAESLRVEDDLAADPICRLLLAHSLLATNENETARRLFASVAGDGDIASWLSFCQDLVDRAPESCVAHYLLGDALARARDSERATNEFGLALKIYPDATLPLLARGVVHAQLGNLDHAVVDLHRAVENRPDLVETRLALGTLYARMGATEGARSALGDLSDAECGPASAHLVLAAVEFAEGNARSALNHLATARLLTVGLEEVIAHNEAHVRQSDSHLDKTVTPPSGGRDSVGTWMSIEYPAGHAQPGDIIVRWEGTDARGLNAWFRMGRFLVPHVGLLGQDGRVYELRIDVPSTGRHGRIYRDLWSRPGRFPEPGFFSVLESDIPITYDGQHTTFRQLSSDTKQELRTAIVDVAESYVGSDTGKYVLAGAAIPGTISQHCGDAVNKILDDALHSKGIQVQRYKGWSAFTRDRKGLVDGRIGDWVKDDWLTQGRLTNPREYKDRFARLEPPANPTTSPLTLAFDREAYQARPFAQGSTPARSREWRWERDQLSAESLLLRLDYGFGSATDGLFATDYFTRSIGSRSRSLAIGAGKELADSYAATSRAGSLAVGWQEYRLLEPSLRLTTDLFDLTRRSARHESAEWQHDALQLGLSIWQESSRSPTLGGLVGLSGRMWSLSEELRRGLSFAEQSKRVSALFDLPSPTADVWDHGAYDGGFIVAHDHATGDGSAMQWTFADRSYWKLPFSPSEISGAIPGPIVDTEFRGTAVSRRSLLSLPHGHLTNLAVRREETHSERYNRFDLTSSGSSTTVRRSHVTYGYRFNGAEQQEAIERVLAARQPSQPSQPPSFHTTLPTVEPPDDPRVAYRRRDVVYDTIKHAPFVPPPPGPPSLPIVNPPPFEPPMAHLRQPKGVLTATIGDAWVDRGEDQLLTVFTLGYPLLANGSSEYGR